MKFAGWLRKALAVALIPLLAFCLVGCGDNSEQVITEGLQSMLEPFRDPTVDSLKEAVVTLGGTKSDAEDMADLFDEMEEEYGIDADQLLEHLFLDYNYAVSNVQVDGDDATAVVTLTTKDFEAAADALEEYSASDEFEGKVEELLEDDSIEDIDDFYKAMYQIVFEKFYECVEDADTVTKDVDVSLTCTDDVWELDDSSTDDLVEALFTGLTSLSSAETDAEDLEDEVVEEVEEEGEGETTASDEEEFVPSHDNAIEIAQMYVEYECYSYAQIVKYMEEIGYSTEDATYGADNCGADWNQEALECAQSYLSVIPFSYDGLIDQLEYEEFTTEQATYAVDNCGADWNEQAVLAAQEYLDHNADATADEVRSSLKWDDFTDENITYALSQVGL